MDRRDPPHAPPPAPEPQSFVERLHANFRSLEADLTPLEAAVQRMEEAERAAAASREQGEKLTREAGAKAAESLVAIESISTQLRQMIEPDSMASLESIGIPGELVRGLAARYERVRRLLSRTAGASCGASLPTASPSLRLVGGRSRRSIPSVELGPWLPWGAAAGGGWLGAVLESYRPGPSWSAADGACLACGSRGIVYTPGHERWRVFVCEADRGHAAVQLRADL